MHKLLERQVRKHFGSVGDVPEPLRPFLERIDEAYQAADRDRTLLERSMDLASQELVARNEALAAQVEREKEARRALRRSEQDYRRIVETATEGIWLLGPDHRTRFVNQRMADLLGYGREDLERMTPLDVITGDGKEGAARAFRELSERMSGQRDVQMRRKDGSTLWVLVSSQAIVGEDGDYDGALGMVTDITARKNAEEGLRQAYEQLQQMEKDRAAFINAAAHEMSTPLTPLKLQVSLLQNRIQDDDKARRSVAILERNVERLAGLVSDLLDSSRLQSGTLKLEAEPVDLARLAQAAVTNFQDVAEERGVALGLEGQAGLRVRCDANRIGQVLDNLLSNAVKFTDEGGTVRVEVREREGMPAVSVHDDGIGMDRDGLKALFKPFSQVHELDPSRPQGTGLGLYICKGIVEQSGGRIWADSPGRGKGATFTFALPHHQRAGSDGDEEE